MRVYCPKGTLYALLENNTVVEGRLFTRKSGLWQFDLLVLLVAGKNWNSAWKTRQNKTFSFFSRWSKNIQSAFSKCVAGSGLNIQLLYYGFECNICSKCFLHWQTIFDDKCCQLATKIKKCKRNRILSHILFDRFTCIFYWQKLTSGNRFLACLQISDIESFL